MTRKNKLRIASVSDEFDYQSLNPADAEKLRKTANRIREKIHASLRSVIESGRALLTAKVMLAHGDWGPWLKAEFGWTERTAQRLMDLAKQFGPKSDIVSDLRISVTALYLLAAPSTPFEARQEAIDRAERGERITGAIATEIIRIARNKAPREGKPLPSDRFSKGLKITLRRFQEPRHQSARKQSVLFVAGVHPVVLRRESVWRR